MPLSEPSHPENFDSGRLSHAYIAAGSFAETLAMAAVCSGSASKPCMTCVHCKKAANSIHPDITIVGKPENKREILIEQIRHLKRDVIIVPNEAEKKAYVIDGADLMNDNAQNAFLQILEEPPPHVVFVLKTDSPDKLLPTVRSRCVEIKNAIVKDAPDAETINYANDFLTALKQGNASLAAFMFQLEKLDKMQFSSFLAASRELAAEELRQAATVGETALCETLSKTERVLALADEFLEFNVGVGHISGLICASLMVISDPRPG